MNSWCESCARKNCCYDVELKPKCYVPITNTAYGTPNSYLVISLQKAQDNHEIEQTKRSE